MEFSFFDSGPAFPSKFASIFRSHQALSKDIRNAQERPILVVGTSPFRAVRSRTLKWTPTTGAAVRESTNGSNGVVLSFLLSGIPIAHSELSGSAFRTCSNRAVMREAMAAGCDHVHSWSVGMWANLEGHENDQQEQAGASRDLGRIVHAVTQRQAVCRRCGRNHSSSLLASQRAAARRNFPANRAAVKRQGRSAARHRFPHVLLCGQPMPPAPGPLPPQSHPSRDCRRVPCGCRSAA